MAVQKLQLPISALTFRLLFRRLAFMVRRMTPWCFDAQMGLLLDHLLQLGVLEVKEADFRGKDELFLLVSIEQSRNRPLFHLDCLNPIKLSKLSPAVRSHVSI